MYNSAKNIILSGGNVLLWDNDVVANTDLSASFCYSAQDVAAKKTRAQVCGEKLPDLNPTVRVELYHGAISPDNLAADESFQVTLT
jgi:molybdopterin/thiamine biosynthesis adenylyltransferase